MPGEDGFTVEFYETCFDMLQDLIYSIRTMKLLKTESCQSLREEELISLIPKEDNNLLELSSWHPITLLNVDYKILAKTIAKTVEPFLPMLIHSDQTGFIKDRYIGQNIRLSDLGRVVRKPVNVNPGLNVN